MERRLTVANPDHQKEFLWFPSPLFPVKLIQAGTYLNKDGVEVPAYDTWFMRGKKPMLVRRASR